MNIYHSSGSSGGGCTKKKGAEKEGLVIIRRAEIQPVRNNQSTDGERTRDILKSAFMEPFLSQNGGRKHGGLYKYKMKAEALYRRQGDANEAGPTIIQSDQYTFTETFCKI